jgi:NAD(P)-dependent dehydrogenase (short-subunit alcohol dehydrogenase family)
MAGRLQGKVAIVTGAGTGIGEAVALKFAREGAIVVVAGLPGDPLGDVVSEIDRRGGRAAPFMGDIADEGAATACVHLAIERFGRLDILVNNAGVLPVIAEVQDFPIDAFDAMVRSNIRSCFVMTRAALPELQQSRGNVVSAGSEAGIIGLPNNAPYGGTKAWVHSFMRGVAVENAKHGVRANCVCPGPIDTAWTHADMGPMDEEMEKSIVQATPLARRGTVEEVANVYAFLASEEASFVTGSLYMVDGGITIGKGPIGDDVPRELRTQPAVTLPVHHEHDGGRMGADVPSGAVPG